MPEEPHPSSMHSGELLERDALPETTDSAELGRLNGLCVAAPVEVLPVRSHLWRVLTVLVAPFPSATRPSGGDPRQRVSSWGRYVESTYVDVVLRCGVGIGKPFPCLTGHPQSPSARNLGRDLPRQKVAPVLCTSSTGLASILTDRPPDPDQQVHDQAGPREHEEHHAADQQVDHDLSPTFSTAFLRAARWHFGLQNFASARKASKSEPQWVQ